MNNKNKIEKCIRFEQAAKMLKSKRGLTEIDCIKLREKLFEEFVESIEYNYFEIEIEELIKHVINREDRSNHHPTVQSEDGNEARK